ncbi:hypothetical protein [Chitinophaga nivalis]|uniref:Uncharacterized protein n=1 Tax=Chitinophaga nivalis TaxID=2991709 RepID=A0ABT3IK56_9BACT|nr:hypothetical protein [Chitinophaga nivalis]MCW3466160.1 hypothetical protein [Chitinophaga nivalis]MCW3484149.1 hypothetical protein [Chitinophaga nivalis]
MSCKLTFKVDMDFTSDLKAGKNPKALLEAFLNNKPIESSFELYARVCNFLLTNAGNFSFIDPEIADLKAAGEATYTGLTFALTDQAALKWLIAKKIVLDQFLVFLKKPETKTVITSVFGGARFEALLAYLDGKQLPLPNAAAIIDVGVKLTQLYVPDGRFATMFNTKTDAVRPILPAFLNAADVNPNLKVNFIACLMERMISRAKNRRDDKERIDKLRVKIGLAARKEDESYFKNYPENLTEVKNKLIALACPAAGAGTIPADLFATTGLYFLKDVGDVILPALVDFKNYIHSITYFDKLAAISQANFVSFTWEATNTNVSVLYGLVAKILDNISVACAYTNGNITLTHNFYLYGFFSLSAYVGNVSSAVYWARDAGYMYCQSNTLDIPLNEQVNNRILFYNTQHKIYLYSGDYNILPFDSPAWPTLFGADNKMIYTKLEKGTDADREILKKWMLARFTACTHQGKRGREMIINFQRTYQPFYVYDKTADTLESHLINPLETGAGGSIGRCEQPTEDSFLWYFAGNLNNLIAEANAVLKRVNFTFTDFDLAAFLGIEKRENLNLANHSLARKAPALKPTAADRYVCMRVPNSVVFYYLCNLPYVPAAGRAGNVINANRLSNFQFFYYRKGVYTAGDPRRPESYKISKKEGDGFTNVNLPISLQTPAVYAQFVNFKKTSNTIKNKGNYLKANKTMRAAAGAVMASIQPYYKYPVANAKNSLGATPFFNSVIKESTEAVKSWRVLKMARDTDEPANITQEWCHLLGHGDGGDERVGNFVSGSKDCNSEQLAIETGQRFTTHSNANRNLFMLKTTAYLLSDGSMEIKDNGKTYLGATLKSIIKKAYTNLDPKDKAKTEAEMLKTVKNAPVAGFVRYKIFARATVDAEFEKVFDYVFEGQGEFFDINQFNIIAKTMVYLLNKEAFYSAFFQFLYPGVPL